VARVVVADLGADRVAAVVDEIRAVHGEIGSALGVSATSPTTAALRSLVEDTSPGRDASTSSSTTPVSRW
jgi:hypothetical protein